MVSYSKGNNEWLFSDIDQQSYSEYFPYYPSRDTDLVKTNDNLSALLNNKAMFPEVTRNYDYINAPGYETTGDVIFWTNCLDCKFEVLI